VNKLLPLIAFSILLLVPVGFQNAFALTEQIFFEDFDIALAGWNQSLCNLTAPAFQVCIIGQDTGLIVPPATPNVPPNSLPNWGFVEVTDPRGGPPLGPVEVRYTKSFTVVDEDDYDVSAWLGIRDCQSCNISTLLYIDGNIVFQEIGVDTSQFPPPVIRKFFHQTTIHFTPGIHNVEMTMFSTDAASGQFRASFDDIIIQREIPDQVIGGTVLPIEQTSLILAGAQSFSWMIPVVLSVIGIGLFVVTRKSENS